MKKVTLVVVIPIGPFCRFEYICDTIESVIHYVSNSHVIILNDDSGKDTGQAVKNRFPDLIVLKTSKNYGRDAGLYLNLSQAFIYAYKHFDFEVLLRLDTDALVIGYNAEIEAIKFFTDHPDVGLIGSYRFDCNGDARYFTKASDQIKNDISFTGIFKNRKELMAHPFKRIYGILFLKKIFRKSRHNGYETGEHCMGGAYFISRTCIEKLYKNGLLFRVEIGWSSLQEDMIFGLFLYSVGMKLGDFATENLPMGLRWRGLPCSPECLLSKQKKIIHSTRFFDRMNESDIRYFFKKQRELEGN